MALANTRLLACASLLVLAGAAFAQAPAPQAPAPQPPASREPTVKDRFDQVVATVTLDPLRKADIDMKHVLDEMAAMNPQPIEKLSPADARQQPTIADAAQALLKKEGRSAAPEPGVTTQDLAYPTAGGTQAARVYKPENAGGEPLPVIVYYHGGGWVIADINVYDASARALAKQAKALVVSLEYRHAPEHKFPAAHDDAVAGYKWAVETAKDWGGDPARVALVGESAGGNLAINVAIAARDGQLQRPLHQVLVYPVAQTNMETESYKANSSAKPLNKAMMGWFMQHVLADQAQMADPRIDLVNKADLKGLPPTTIILAEIDPLHDDGIMLGEKLKQAGVAVTVKDYAGVTHEFFGTAAAVAKAKEAQAAAAAARTAAFAKPAAN